METSLDRVIAGVASMLNDPPGFSNRLNDVYMAIEAAIDRHQLFVGMHQEARLVARKSAVLPAKKDRRQLPDDVGSVRSVRIIPQTQTLREWAFSPIDVLSLTKLHQFKATHFEQDYPQDFPPVCCSEWRDEAGKLHLEFSHACSFDVPIEIICEPISAGQLDPDNPPQHLRQFYFLLVVEVANDMLPKFNYDAVTHKRIYDLIQQRLQEGNLLLQQFLQQNDSAKGGMTQAWGGYRMRQRWR